MNGFMHRELYFEEKAKREKRFWLTLCRYLIWAVMIGISVLFASRALPAEGKERKPEGSQGFEKALQKSIDVTYLPFLYGGREEDNILFLREYRTALLHAWDCQRKLMKYALVSEEVQLRYGRQTYHMVFVRGSQETGLKTGSKQEFDLYWCNALSALTMEAYQQLDEEGKELLTNWQLSREQWKEAEIKKRAAKEGESAEICGQINRLYFRQLAGIMK